MALARKKAVRRRPPLAAVLLLVAAAPCLVAAVLCFVGVGGLLHPALADPMAGVAFLVSALALAGAGAFPLVLARLAGRERC